MTTAIRDARSGPTMETKLNPELDSTSSSSSSSSSSPTSSSSSSSTVKAPGTSLFCRRYKKHKQGEKAEGTERQKLTDLDRMIHLSRHFKKRKAETERINKIKQDARTRCRKGGVTITTQRPWKEEYKASRDIRMRNEYELLSDPAKSDAEKHEALLYLLMSKDAKGAGNTDYAYEPRISNMVCHAILTSVPPLRLITDELHGKSESRAFPSSSLILKNPVATVGIASTGKTVITGTTTFEDALLAAHLVAFYSEQATKAPCDVTEFDLVNIASYGSVGFSVDLFKLEKKLQLLSKKLDLEAPAYHPASFPGVKWKPLSKNQNLVVQVFLTGKYTAVGFANMGEFRRQVSYLDQVITQLARRCRFSEADFEAEKAAAATSLASRGRKRIKAESLS